MDAREKSALLLKEAGCRVLVMWFICWRENHKGYQKNQNR
jgi:hypothetical protein